MYYAKTRADNSGYTNHRVICLVVMGSSFDSEQVQNRHAEFHFNAFIIIEKLYFFLEILSQKGGITQIKCWMELSSLVNRLGSTLSTNVLSFKLIALIVIEKF